ncbi:lysylphosphatidylglycerol synthase transmembrane domain-containing protein [Rhizobium sp. GN54]|uniref:lysylphosphatidylglycerol synthase transmembrane domain-containing protein n=1 Tax=Rhizobium sp. GN54 TaxID=2898150 RepID=UPI001E541AE7|nr:lysylphosphatidylglycerol synthase transmembrane domain-containing protein [Rhizobium sp. GN54]MCD2184662.1 flippase-like domain-containing protein [Rhizobium sp. GN54]
MGKLKRVAIGAGLLLLTVVISTVDPAGVLDALGRVPPGHVIVALAVVQVQIVLSALRWRFTAARLGHVIPASVAIREYYLGGVLNQILPGGIAGDAARAYRSGDEQAGGWKRAATAVVLERLSGQFAFFLLTCLGLAAWAILLPDAMPVDPSPLAWIAVAIVAVCATVAGWLRKPLKVRFGRLGPDLAAAFLQDGALGMQAGLSILIVGTYVATFLLASDAVGATLPLIAAVTAVPLCLLTMLVPVGIGGWGTREAAAAALWPFFGFSGAEGVAASLLYGIFSLAGTALPGLVVLAFSLTGGLGRRR